MSDYIFTDAQHLKEFERLKAIEKVCDPASRRLIEATGIAANWRCLEVGAGAGSIATWMAEVVGVGGQVIAVDVNTRFVKNIKRPNLEVLAADIRYLTLENAWFDLVHARCVLIHISDYQAALSKMLALLKPGGWLVLEEPDFSASRAITGEETACQSMNRVNRAIQRLFSDRGMDYAFGVKLPAILQGRNLQPICVENDAHLANGGSGIATVMKLSTLQLAEQYLTTGEATQTDLDKYCWLAEDPNAWAIYYATVRVGAQKTAA
jgi:SAM-dependent methyltransferase